MTTSSAVSVAEREPGLPGQTVVVIGASAGIGLETARRARAEGAGVILTPRCPPLSPTWRSSWRPSASTSSRPGSSTHPYQPRCPASTSKRAAISFAPRSPSGASSDRPTSLVTMTTHVPDGTPDQAVADVRAREAAHPTSSLPRDAWVTMETPRPAAARTLDASRGGLPLKTTPRQVSGVMATSPGPPGLQGICPEFVGYVRCAGVRLCGTSGPRGRSGAGFRHFSSGGPGSSARMIGTKSDIWRYVRLLAAVLPPARRSPGRLPGTVNTWPSARRPGPSTTERANAANP